MAGKPTRIFRIAYKKHNDRDWRIKRLPVGTSVAKAKSMRAKMAIDPSIREAELREERL